MNRRPLSSLPEELVNAWSVFYGKCFLRKRRATGTRPIMRFWRMICALVSHQADDKGELAEDLDLHGLGAALSRTRIAPSSTSRMRSKTSSVRTS